MWGEGVVVLLLLFVFLGVFQHFPVKYFVNNYFILFLYTYIFGICGWLLQLELMNSVVTNIC